MKILCGYLPPSEGKAFVEGMDVEHSAEKVKKRIGYLPENNALYNEMYVREYLEHIARLYPHGKHIADQVDEVIGLCGLEPEQNKKIGALSKGYKQRVGLAQALIHNPEVLILDEPTSGLDPNQLVEIRKLVQEAGKEKTVLLSTHIMQEVEAMCQRVIIINKGRIIADERTEDLAKLISRSEKILLELDKPIDAKLLMQIKGVQAVMSVDANRMEIQTDGKTDVRQQLFAYAVAKGLSIRSLQKINSSLEQIFQELTK